MGLINHEPPTITIESSDDQASPKRPAWSTTNQPTPVSQVQMIFEEDNSLVCKKCHMDFWYKSELHDHMKKEHFIADPVDWLKERRKEEFQRELDERKRKTALSWAEQEKKAKLTAEQKEERERKERDAEFKRLQKLHAKRMMEKMAKDHSEDLIRTYGNSF